MEVKINREIRNYTESMFFGLSLRQFVFSLLAVGVAVLLYFVLKPHVGTETVSWMCMENIRARQIYDTGVTAEYGDQLLTLSTCEYTYPNGRFVVVAKKV